MSKGYNFPNLKPASRPDVLVNVYGNHPPKAAEFDRGISTREGAARAADAVRQRSAELSRGPSPNPYPRLNLPENNMALTKAFD